MLAGPEDILLASLIAAPGASREDLGGHAVSVVLAETADC